MARGESGRIVIEVDPTFKKELYLALGLEGTTLKDWFTRRGEQFVRDTNEPSLFSRYPAHKPSGIELNDKPKKATK
jgi:hypothetical protein